MKHLCNHQTLEKALIMAKQYVYRVQDKDGRGPFKPGFTKEWAIERDDYNNLVSWLEEFGRVDKQILYGATAGSACETIDQLRRWFTKDEYKKLIEFGYHAVKIKVDRIIAKSEIQCFVSRSIPFNKKIREIDLYDLLHVQKD